MGKDFCNPVTRAKKGEILMGGVKMRMIIREYWNKVSNENIDGNTYLKKVLPEYELKSVVSYPESYSSVIEMQKELRSRFPMRFMELIDKGIRFNLGKQWGIHSYQDVTLE